MQISSVGKLQSLVAFIHNSRDFAPPKLSTLPKRTSKSHEISFHRLLATASRAARGTRAFSLIPSPVSAFPATAAINLSLPGRSYFGSYRTAKKSLISATDSSGSSSNCELPRAAQPPVANMTDCSSLPTSNNPSQMQQQTSHQQQLLREQRARDVEEDAQRQQYQEEAAAAVATVETAGLGCNAPMSSVQRRPMVVILTGPTAVGKTAISLMLAQCLQQPPPTSQHRPQQQLQQQHQLDSSGEAGGRPAASSLDPAPDVSTAHPSGMESEPGFQSTAAQGLGEVISADSVQVYRGLDVGSDKLPPLQRQGVPHHLIDVKDPDEDFSAGEFYECARPVAEDIIKRGGIPLVVGGTGLYLRWFVVGKGGAPRATPEALAAVTADMQAAWKEAEDVKRMAVAEQQAPSAAADNDDGNDKSMEPSLTLPVWALTEEERWEAAAALLLRAGDEVAYGRIRGEHNNYYRLERALSILHMHPGAKLADFDPQAVAIDPLDLEYDFRCFFLHRPRLQLYHRIAARVEEMVVGGGLLEEAAGLLHKGLAPGQNMAAKAIGYRQAMEWLIAARVAGRPVGLADLCALHASICLATHKLVRSQMTWFRDDPMYKWIDVEGRESLDVVQEILRELAKPRHEGGCGDSGRLSKQEQKSIMTYRTQFRLLTVANAKAEVAIAAAAAEELAALPAGLRLAKPKSKSALAAAAAAAAAAMVEHHLSPLLMRINDVLLPGIPNAALATTEVAATATEGHPATGGHRASVSVRRSEPVCVCEAMVSTDLERDAKRSKSDPVVIGCDFDNNNPRLTVND